VLADEAVRQPSAEAVKRLLHEALDRVVPGFLLAPRGTA
jgi:hypothetical protein